MKRAWRTAETLVQGPEILEFIAEPGTRDLLVSFAKAGRPPVTAISNQLFKRFGSDVTTATVKQAIGIGVRAVLEEEGYQVIEKGLRLKDPVFRTGSIYARVDKPAAPKSQDMGEAMLASLNEAQALRAATVLEHQHPGVLRKAMVTLGVF